MAEIFDHYFRSTSTTSDFILPHISQLPTPLTQPSTIEIDRFDVYEALINLDTTKAVGCDSIHSSILKNCTTTLLESIFHLFSICLHTSSIPLDWKLHKIIPIPKKGDLLTVSNYRLISLICILSKVLESIIYKKIIHFILPQLSRNQFGFLRNGSCLCQLLTYFASIYEAVNNKNQADVLYPSPRTAIQDVADGDYWTSLVVVSVLPVDVYTLCQHRQRKLHFPPSAVGSPAGQHFRPFTLSYLYKWST